MYGNGEEPAQHFHWIGEKHIYVYFPSVYNHLGDTAGISLIIVRWGGER